MKQGYLIKFIAFVAALLGYLYVFDSSFTVFIGSATKVADLDFSDRFLLNTITWLVGFWGILVYLNVGNKSVRVTMWSVFIISTFINFIYNIAYGRNLSTDNPNQIEEAFFFWHHLNGTEILKFLVLSGMIIGLALFIGPLSIGIASWFPWVLVAISFITALFLETGIALQSAYIVPAILIHKYTLWLFSYLKNSFSKN